MADEKTEMVELSCSNELLGSKVTGTTKKEFPIVQAQKMLDFQKSKNKKGWELSSAKHKLDKSGKITSA